MAFVKKGIYEFGSKGNSKQYQIGDIVETTMQHESCVGIFTKGSKVRIISVGERGYDIADDEGNKMYEIGWVI